MAQITDHLLQIACLYLVYYIGLYAGKRQGRRHEREVINSMLSRAETSLAGMVSRYPVMFSAIVTLQHLRIELNRSPDTKTKATTQDGKQ